MMSEKVDYSQDIQNLNIRLNQLTAAYTELQSLNENDAHQETLREGFLVKAGKNTETILKYICKVKGITVTPKPLGNKINENRTPMLNDYIFHLKDKGIINEDIHHHLEIIKKWRNRTAHDLSDDSNPIDFIKDSTIESVNDSFNYLKYWFFKNYLKEQYDDNSNNLYERDINKGQSTSKTNEQFKKNPLNIPDFSILKQSNEYKNVVKKKKQKTLLLMFLLCFGLGLLLYYKYFEKLDGKENEIAQPIPMNKDQVYLFLTDYFDKSNSKTIDVDQYFADKIDQYITARNLTPSQINKIKSENVDYIDAKNTVEQETLFLYSKNDSVSYWRFWTEYICFRPKKNSQFQKCKVLMEFGINRKHKITSVKQIEYTEPIYSKKRPK